MSTNQNKRRSKQEILELYQLSMKEKGRSIGRQSFCEWANLKQSELNYYWPRHSDLIIEAGGQPNTLNSKSSEDLLFNEYARVCLHLKKIPTSDELKIADRSFGSKTSPLRNRNKKELLFEFRNWLLNESAPEYKSILDFSGWEISSGSIQRISTDNITVVPSPVLQKVHPFLPTCLVNLTALARNENPDNNDNSQTSLIFERRCADAFRAIGFEVTNLGQGKGRSADYLAISRSDGYAVIVDAKAYTDGYYLKTEDRKFKEYVERHTEEMQRLGIKRCYLCIISSSFRSQDITKLGAALANSAIKGFSLWTAKHLMDTVEQSIKERWQFSLKNLESKFFSNSIKD